MVVLRKDPSLHIRVRIGSCILALPTPVPFQSQVHKLASPQAFLEAYCSSVPPSMWISSLCLHSECWKRTQLLITSLLLPGRKGLILRSRLYLILRALTGSVVTLTLITLHLWTHYTCSVSMLLTSSKIKRAAEFCCQACIQNEQ